MLNRRSTGILITEFISQEQLQKIKEYTAEQVNVSLEDIENILDFTYSELKNWTDNPQELGGFWIPNLGTWYLHNVSLRRLITSRIKRFRYLNSINKKPEEKEISYFKNLWLRYKLAQKFYYNEKQIKEPGKTVLSRIRLNYWAKRLEEKIRLKQNTTTVNKDN